MPKDKYGNDDQPNPAKEVSTETTAERPDFKYDLEYGIPGPNPYDWYWTARDGRIYSSAAQKIINKGDKTYAAKIAEGYRFSVWPEDAQGNQTKEALQAVVDQFKIGLRVP